MGKIFPRLSIQHLWGLTILAGIFAFLNVQPIQQNDFWWHIAVGRETLKSGQVLQTDLFSFTMQGEPYPSYNIFWLSDVLIYILFEKGGPAITILFNSLIIVTAYSIVFFTAWRRSGNWRVSAAAIFFAAALGFGNWNIRPQSITYLYCALIILVINEYRITGKRGCLYLLPCVMLLWVNSHGSFPIGIILIILWFLDEFWQAVLQPYIKKMKIEAKKIWEPLLISILAGLACFFNPLGLRTVQYISTMMSNSVVQSYILEWQPPTMSSLEGSIILIGILISIVILSASPKRPSLYDLSIFTVFAFLGFKYIRGSIWFGIVMAPILAKHLSALTEKWFDHKNLVQQIKPNYTLNYFFLGLLLVICGFSLPWFKSFIPLTAQKAGLYAVDTPFAATQATLQNKLPGFIFNDMSFGSYLNYAAYPIYLVFVDSRIELFPEEIWNDYAIISAAQCGWENLIDRYNIQTLFLNLDMEPQLIESARQSDHWQEVYQDNIAVIFTRNTP